MAKKKINADAASTMAANMATQAANEATVQQAQKDAADISTYRNRQDAGNLQPSTQNGSETGVSQFDTTRLSVTDQTVAEAMDRCDTYHLGMTYMFDRLIKNEEYYRQQYAWYDRHKETEGDVLPESASGYLLNAIQNKVADMMDNLPSANILAREKSDEPTAEMLSKIIPVIMDRNNFTEKYYNSCLQKVKNGFSVYGCFWNPIKDNIGEVEITNIEPLCLRWEPGVKNIQDSKDVFMLTEMDNDTLIAMYPQLEGKLSGNDGKLDDYINDDHIDRSKQTTVYDWYYKITKGFSVGGQVFPKTVVHYARFCAGMLLFSSENDPTYENGWYEDGLYPFVFDVMFPIKNTCVGFGIIDSEHNTQQYIDKLDFAVLQNSLANARPRYFSKTQGGINEEEFADFTKTVVHYTGNKDDLVPMDHPVLASNVLEYLANKKEDLKENTGNRDFSQGTTTGGVTAASAIAALQESSSKASRVLNQLSYEAFKNLVIMIINRMQQFYTVDRAYRITTDNGVVYQSIGMKELRPGSVVDAILGTAMGGRKPIYDIDVSAEKQSPYSKIATNEFAKEMFQLGMFNPQLADQAVPCIELMDFDKKQEVLMNVRRNQQLYIQNQQMMALLQNMLNDMNGGMGQMQEQEQPTASAVKKKSSIPSDTDQMGNTTVYKDNSIANQYRHAAKSNTKVRA